MPRQAEPKRPIGIPESIYKEIEKYAMDQNLFMYQVVVKLWEEFKSRINPQNSQS